MANKEQGLVGTDRVIRKLDEQILDGRALEQVLMQACLIVENEAKRMAPVDTGVLRNSIRSEVSTSGSIGGEGVVGTNEEYAPYVELGTGLYATNGDGRQTPWSYQDDDGNWHTTIGQHPQPFLRPALELHRQEIINFIRDRLEYAKYQNTDSNNIKYNPTHNV